MLQNKKKILPHFVVTVPKMNQKVELKPRWIFGLRLHPYYLKEVYIHRQRYHSDNLSSPHYFWQDFVLSHIAGKDPC